MQTHQITAISTNRLEVVLENMTYEYASQTKSKMQNLFTQSTCRCVWRRMPSCWALLVVSHSSTSHDCCDQRHKVRHKQVI
jgi:hypothetical protein